MNSHNGASAFGDPGLYGGGVYIPGFGIAIREDRPETVPQNRMARGEESKTRQDDFALKIERPQDQEQTAGATRDGNAMRDPDPFRRGSLEAGDEVRVGDHPCLIGGAVV